MSAPWHAAHLAAMARGQAQYIDPGSGYPVFTEAALKARGTCCGSGCRHCPYDYVAVPERFRGTYQRRAAEAGED